jgi:hypothetical protein
VDSRDKTTMGAITVEFYKISVSLILPFSETRVRRRRQKPSPSRLVSGARQKFEHPKTTLRENGGLSKCVRRDVG